MGLFLEFLISSKNMKFLLQINRERGKFGVKFYIPQTGRQEKEGELGENRSKIRRRINEVEESRDGIIRGERPRPCKF